VPASPLQALAALILWIPICLAFFGTMKPLKAAIMSLIVGIVLLPERVMFDPPGLPPFDKQAFACMGSYLGALLFARDKLRRAKYLRGAEFFFIIVMLGNVGTALTNPDTVIIGGAMNWDGKTRSAEIPLQALGLYDIPSATVRDFIGILLPFHIGRTLVRNRGEAVVMSGVLAGTMLVLLAPMVLELRISPQLHRWVYGFHSGSFAHNMRDGGFKAVLFFQSGLALAMFLLTGMFACVMLMREKKKIAGFPPNAVLGVFWFALLISRNAAANLYAFAVIPPVLRRATGSAARLAVLLALLVVSFPALRATGIFPADQLVELAGKWSEHRAQSLEFRFDNEDILLERASERKWFGWGGYGRNRVYDPRGKDISVTDGEWIIRYGIRGAVGFVGSFGLLVWPVIAAYRRRRKIRDPDTVALLDTMSLMVAVSAVDMLPNGFFTVLPYFYAGALAGLTEGVSDAEPDPHVPQQHAPVQIRVPDVQQTALPPAQGMVPYDPRQAGQYGGDDPDQMGGR